MTAWTPTGRERWLAPAITLALCLVTLLAYWPAQHFAFLNWDDLTYITKNDHVRGGLSWSGLVWAFTHSYSSNWHPLTWLSHMLDCQLYGLKPAGHHLTSLSLHSANASLLFLVLKRLTGALWRSALVAALFALHPLHVESVAWVAERKDVLSGLFFMLTIGMYAGYVRNPKAEAVLGSAFGVRRSMFGVRTSSQLRSPIFYLLSLFSFACGLMSKPMLVTLPFLLLLLDYWPLGRMQKAEGRRQKAEGRRQKAEDSAAQRPSRLTFHVSRLVLEKLPYFALSAASCLITFLAQKRGGAVASFTALPLDTRLANAVVAYVQYLAKTFWPVRLSPIYLHPEEWGPWLVASAAAVLVLLTVAAWLGRRRFPYALVGWLWFLGMLVPVIGIVQVGNQAFADRYTYLPLVGIMVAVVWLGAEAFVKGALSPSGRRADIPVRSNSRTAPGWQRTAVAGRSRLLRTGMSARRPVVTLLLPVLLSLAILATLAWRTREQLLTWRDTGTLFARALALDPHNVQALYGLGAHFADIGRLDEGKCYLEEAIHLHPAYPEALATLAGIFDSQGKYAEATRFYQAALKAQPDQEGVLNNLAWLLASCPDAAFRNGPEAVRLAARACERSAYAKPLFIGTLAAAQAEAGDFPAAIATAERAAAVAATLHLDDVAARNRELIQLYRQGRAYHDAPKTTATDTPR